MNKLKLWFLATRPWSFPMTLLVMSISILYGAWQGHYIDLLLALIALFGGVLLHVMTNVINDYFDTIRGIDRKGVGTVEYRPHPLVHGFMTERQVLVLGLGSGLAAICLASLLVFLERPLALILGAIGFLLAYGYSGPPLNLKYIGFGELGVYLAWGVMMPLGAYYVATGSIDPRPVIFTIPLAVLVVEVLLANNIRDIRSDEEAGIKTIAVMLGYGRSLALYKSLLALSYLIPPILTLLDLAPVTVLIIYFSLPKALKLVRDFERSPPKDADPRTANLLLSYGILYLIGTSAPLLL